jgi:hypothetical protein
MELQRRPAPSAPGEPGGEDRLVARDIVAAATEYLQESLDARAPAGDPGGEPGDEPASNGDG